MIIQLSITGIGGYLGLGGGILAIVLGVALFINTARTARNDRK